MSFNAIRENKILAKKSKSMKDYQHAKLNNLRRFVKGSDWMGNRVNPDHTAHELGLHYFSEIEINKKYALESLEALMLMLCFVVSDSPGSDCLFG